MKTEIEYAVNYLVDTIKDKLTILSDEQQETLRRRLLELLQERFESHWYTDKPMKGSAFRCINISVEDNSVDLVLRRAAEESDISTKDLVNVVFDKGLALWVDPNDVSCRLGKGAIFPIYRKITEKRIKRSDSPPLGVTNKQHRPQLRPRSISPPQFYNGVSSTSTSSYQHQRPRSTTPPGFSSMDAGQMFQTLPSSMAYSAENLHKVWDSIPNTSYESSAARTPASYVSTSTYPVTSTSSYGTGDAVYSFNQYSSYYNPNFYWKRSRSQVKQKSFWQDDEVFQRYHWSRNDNFMPVAGNNMAINNVQNYSYPSSRHVQEVC